MTIQELLNENELLCEDKNTKAVNFTLKKFKEWSDAGKKIGAEDIENYLKSLVSDVGYVGYSGDTRPAYAQIEKILKNANKDSQNNYLKYVNRIEEWIKNNKGGRLQGFIFEREFVEDFKAKKSENVGERHVKIELSGEGSKAKNETKLLNLENLNIESITLFKHDAYCDGDLEVIDEKKKGLFQEQLNKINKSEGKKYFELKRTTKKTGELLFSESIKLATKDRIDAFINNKSEDALRQINKSVVGYANRIKEFIDDNPERLGLIDNYFLVTGLKHKYRFEKIKKDGFSVGAVSYSDINRATISYELDGKFTEINLLENIDENINEKNTFTETEGKIKNVELHVVYNYTVNYEIESTFELDLQSAYQKFLGKVSAGMETIKKSINKMINTRKPPPVSARPTAAAKSTVSTNPPVSAARHTAAAARHPAAAKLTLASIDTEKVFEGFLKEVINKM